MKIAWMLLALASCTPATPVVHVAEVHCPPWPRELRLRLPATQVEILEWHDRVRERDHQVYKTCAQR